MNFFIFLKTNLTSYRFSSTVSSRWRGLLNNYPPSRVVGLLIRSGNNQLSRRRGREVCFALLRTNAPDTVKLPYCHALMRACCSADDAWRVMRDIEDEYNVKPDVESKLILLGHLAIEGRWNEAATTWSNVLNTASFQNSPFSSKVSKDDLKVSEYFDFFGDSDPHIPTSIQLWWGDRMLFSPEQLSFLQGETFLTRKQDKRRRGKRQRASNVIASNVDEDFWKLWSLRTQREDMAARSFSSSFDESTLTGKESKSSLWSQRDKARFGGGFLDSFQTRKTKANDELDFKHHNYPRIPSNVLRDAVVRYQDLQTFRASRLRLLHSWGPIPYSRLQILLQQSKTFHNFSVLTDERIVVVLMNLSSSSENCIQLWKKIGGAQSPLIISQNSHIVHSVLRNLVIGCCTEDLKRVVDELENANYDFKDDYISNFWITQNDSKEIHRLRNEKIEMLSSIGGADGLNEVFSIWNRLLKLSESRSEEVLTSLSAVCGSIVAACRTVKEARTVIERTEAVGAKIPAQAHLGLTRLFLIWAYPYSDCQKAFAMATKDKDDFNDSAFHEERGKKSLLSLSFLKRRCSVTEIMSNQQAEVEADVLSNARASLIRRWCSQGVKGQTIASDLINAIDQRGQLCIRCIEERKVMSRFGILEGKEREKGLINSDFLRTYK
eukprot:g2231.t1